MFLNLCLGNRVVYLTAGLEDPVSPSCLMSPHQGEGGQGKKACSVVGEGTYPAYKFYEGVISEHFRLLQQHCERERRGPSTGSPPASKEGQNSSWAEEQQRWVDVEKLIQFEWLTWSRAAHCSQNRRTMAILDQPQSCRTGRNRMSFPSCLSANLNTGGRVGCDLSD